MRLGKIFSIVYLWRVPTNERTSLRLIFPIFCMLFLFSIDNYIA